MSSISGERSEISRPEGPPRVRDVVEDIRRDPIERKGHVYHPIPYREFDGLTVSADRQEAEKKLSLTIETIQEIRGGDLQGARVLDIGARGGYHTFSLDRLGAEVTAFEPHPRYGRLGAVLAEEKARSVIWHPTTLDLSVVEGERFDVALMLSVFQWMAAGGNRMQEALQELRRVSEISSVLIFEMGFNKGRSAIRTGKRNHYAQLVRMLKENTRYSSFKRIGKTYAWGAPRHMVVASDRSELQDGPVLRAVRGLRI